MSDKNTYEIIPLSEGIYRFVEKTKNDGKVVQDFKFKVYETPSLSAAVESVVIQIIRKRLKLKARHKITIISDESNNSD